MNSQKAIARGFGIFFILTFISYGFGTALTDSVVGSEDALSNIEANKGQFVLGALLMGLFHTLFNTGILVMMMQVLKSFNKLLSYAYLSVGITATITLIVGVIFLLLYLPLGSIYVEADSSQLLDLEIIGSLLSKGNFYAYQLGMSIWGIGGLVLCYLLYQSRLVPRGLSVFGFITYPIFIAGTLAELFGYPTGDLLALPGGLFEISLSLFLIVKGFRMPSTAA